MSETPPNTASKAPSPTPAPHIGAFVLETLTLGMYGEPRHTLREYVQNAFDGIRGARRLRRLEGLGTVSITLGDDEIKIRDDGLGVAAQQAYRTLTSVGASKKDRQRDAGFRGIGRLAGMAYCDTLTFETSFPDETTLTTVSFDCKKLLVAMAPDSGGEVELSKLLATAITFTQAADAVPAAEHFFEVRMTGLSHAPECLTDYDQVCDYLSETVPVAYNPNWPRGAELEASYKSAFGAPMERTNVVVARGVETTTIFKPYSDTYEHANGLTDLTSIDFHADPDGRYWGWVGRVKDPVAITDWKTRGLRIRTRNIQVDGTQIFEELFSVVKPSYGRFTTYYVGEFHIDPEKVIPNARRDDFEETSAWLEIKKELVDGLCTDLAKDAYAASKNAQEDIKKVVGQVDQLKAEGRRLTSSQNASYEQVVDLLAKARRLRKNASSALKTANSVDATAADADGAGTAQSVTILQEANRDVESIESQARMLIGRFLDDDEKTASLRARIRAELIDEILAIVNPYVDPPTYQAIRKQVLAIR